MTSHDVFTKPQFKGPAGRLKKTALSLLFALPDRIHSVTWDARNNLFNYLPLLKRLARRHVVIPHGIDVERYLTALPRNIRSELGLPPNAFLIGFLGRFMSQKGFAYLVDAVSQIVKEAPTTKKPVVIAVGNGGFIREEREAIRRKGLDDHFCFLPFVPDVASTLKDLDVVVMPSLWEACGLLAMETLVAGVPLIASRCIGLRETVIGTPAVTVAPRNSAAIAAALLDEMQSPKKDLFAVFSVEAAKRFTNQKTANHIERLILALCPANASR